MAHFAKVRDGVVVQVVKADPDFFDSLKDTSPGTWLQTSYNTRGGVHYDSLSRLPSSDQSKALRKNFAGVGFAYDAAKDAFIAPQPFKGWLLDEATCLWNPPVPMPADGKAYAWDEDSLSWVEEAR